MDGGESPLHDIVSPSTEDGEYSNSCDIPSQEYHNVHSPKECNDDVLLQNHGYETPQPNSPVDSASHVSTPSSSNSMGQYGESANEFDAGSPNIPDSPEADQYEGNVDESEPHLPSPTSSLGENETSISQTLQPESPAQSTSESKIKKTDEKSTGDTSADDEHNSEKPQSDDGSDKGKIERRRMISSDDNGDDDDSGDDSDGRKNLLDSDDSDEDLDEEQRKKKLGNLIVNIFGEDIDEDADVTHEDDDEQAHKPDEESLKVERDDYGSGEKIDRDSAGFQWDFDLMLREKKAEKKRKRRRRDAGIDIINDDDGLIAHMVNAMKNAAKEDRYSNTERKPALKKRKMLHEVKMMLLRMDMIEAMIDGGMMSAVSEWLAPLPDKSLPALEIRTELLKILSGFGNLDQLRLSHETLTRILQIPGAGVLKQSGLGRAVMLLYKHPRETKENKAMAAHIIREWSRPIFQLDTDFRSVSREERVQRDLEHMSSVKKKRMSGEGGSTALPTPPKSKEREINRARVPRPSTKDYVVRPKSNVEGEFKGERKGKAFARLDKTHREFLERTKRVKAKRAVGVSLEGRNLAL
ncbi:IWS1protein [Dictyocaulus viviparus]|uniref:IWS1protein n=1 Tax=Dictyocaulus viviparus TaxID=29172 RepID=A0A0D8XUZ7_DICVI|nr:IWS1protein [Dictyocaulus viviparus]